MIQKFRAWHGDKMHTDKDCYFTFSNGHWSCYLTKEYGGSFCCDSNTEGVVLMQYVGLHDKHGKELFEGDLVNGGDYDGSIAVGKVVYWKGMFVLEPIGKLVVGVCDIYNKLSHLEKIGNIYQNPELIK